MNKTQKIELADSMKESLQGSSFIMLFHYRGLSDKKLFDLRVSLKSEGVHLKIIKNTLAKVAVKDSDLKVLLPYLAGPTAIAYTNNPVSLAKIAMSASKENKELEIQIGCLNQSILSKEAISSLSKLGSLEEVRSSFLSVLKGSQSKFVRIVNAPASGVVSLLNNYIASKE